MLDPKIFKRVFNKVYKAEMMVACAVEEVIQHKDKLTPDEDRFFSDLHLIRLLLENKSGEAFRKTPIPSKKGGGR